MIKVAGTFGGFFHGEGRDWHHSEMAARNKAEAMRIHKITSLKKQIAKLEKMTFASTQGETQ